jgi:hypothetical protein
MELVHSAVSFIPFCSCLVSSLVVFVWCGTGTTRDKHKNRTYNS